MTPFAKLSLTGLIATIISTSSLANQSLPWFSEKKQEKPSFNVTYYKPRFTLGPFYDTQVSAFGLYDLFIPLATSEKTIVFLDGRYLQNKGPTHEGNYGMGFRHILSGNKSLIGAYGFYDRRRSTLGNYFQQLTFGGEYKRESWSLVANAYIPVGKTSYFDDGLDFASLVPAASGPFQNIAFRRGQEKAMTGGDLLGGVYIPRTHGLRLYLGGFVYAASGVQTAAGPIVHGEYNIHRTDGKRVLALFNRIYLVADYQHDDLRGSVWFAGARFDIMLGHQQELVGIQKRMQDFVRRDLAIESGPNSKGATQLLKNADGSLVTVQVTSSALTGSAANVIGVSGAINNGTNTVTLTDGQTITGGNYSFIGDGHPYNLMIGSSGSISTTAAAAGPTITFTAANLTGTTTIENITLSSASTAGGTGVIANNFANAVGSIIIRNVTANETGTTSAYAIDFRTAAAAGANTNNISISGSTITSNTGGLNFAVRAATNVMSASLASNSITTNASGTANRPIDFFADNSGTLTVGNVTGNTILGQNAGINTVRFIATNLAGANGTINVTGSFSGNTLTNTGGGAESALLVTSSDGGVAAAGTYAITFTGAISNNTFNSNGTNPVVFFNANNTSGAPVITSTITLNNTSGLTNNTITSTNAGAGSFPVSVVTANAALETANITINNFFSNTITTGGTATGINVDETAVGTSNLTINVGNGATGLSASNGGAVVTTTGAPTYNPAA